MTSRVIANSKATGSWVVETWAKLRLRTLVIYNGLVADVVKPASAVGAVSGAPPVVPDASGPIVMVVGRLIAGAGVGFISAISKFL